MSENAVQGLLLPSSKPNQQRQVVEIVRRLPLANVSNQVALSHNVIPNKQGQVIKIIRAPFSNVLNNQVSIIKPQHQQTKSLNPCQTFHALTIDKPTKPSPLSDISNHVVKSVSSSSNLHHQNVSLSYSCIQPFQKVGDTTKNQKACTSSKNRLSLSNHHARDRNPSDGVIVRARDIAANLLCSSDSSSGKTSDLPRPSPPLTHPIPEVIPSDKTHDAESLSSDDTDLSDLSDAFEPEKNSHLENSRQHTAEQIETTKRNRKVAGCRKSSDEIATIVEEARERSLSDPLFQKIHEKMPGLMADYVITEAELSENPVNPEDGEYWTATLRVNIDNKSDALEWLSNYENASSCDFRVTKCKKTNNSKRLVLKREYHCHHDTKPKEKSNSGPKKSKNWISKHTNCRSIIRFTIKQKSMAWSSDYLLKEYPCEIFIRHHHNHPVKCADAQRLRRPNQEVKEKFLKLFAQGHSPISAIETHKFDLMMEHGDNFNFILADGSRCPSNFWVYKLYKKVCVGHYGPQSGEGIIKTLRDYALKYNKEMGSECMKVEILNDNDLVVALCTPLMQRTHELLPSSGEMIYVDSSGNMDALNCRVFPVMTHSVAGALPLGIMIVSSESEEVLAVAFNILKSILPPKAFYGRGAAVGPKIAMTDDCPNERNAIRRAFPGIILLLCLFHVLQAFWRYLWNREHNVALKNRPELFNVLRDLAYAPDENTFNQRKEEALENPMLLSHTLVLNHIEKFLGRSKEWALFQRVDLLTRGNNTNNYSEATMKLIKDKVLGRTKAFNPVQLVDFLVTRFPSYIEMRISDVLNNRSMNTFKSRYFIRPEKLENLISEKLPSPPDCYKVSNTSKTTSYIVMMSEEICSCPEGKSGKPCKHLCKVVKDFNLSSTQLLPREQLGEKTKLMLFEIMQGHRNVPPGWFRMVHQTRSSDPTEVPTVHVEGVASAEETILHAESSDVDNTNISLDTAANDDDVSARVSLTVSNLTALNASWIDKLTKRPDIFLEPFEKLIEANQKMIKSDSSLTSSLTVFGREQACAANKPLSVKHFKKSTIPVQPTARGRRTVHLEGKQAQRGGRPSNAMFHFSGVGDHNSYATTSTSKRKSNEPHWASLPNKRNMPAPHALMACVNANRMLGGNHSKK